MAQYPWKTTLSISALLATIAYAFAQSSGDPLDMHGQMRQRDMMSQMRSQMSQHEMHTGSSPGMHGGMHEQQFATRGVPTMPGQDAFGAIQEIVQILQSDPKTDWSKVNIDALREHLIDMNEVTLHAVATPRQLGTGIEFTVTGEGRVLEAIKRMVPAHVKELQDIGWNVKCEDLQNGVKLTVIASEAESLTKLRALGFMGIMVQGRHHQPHHLMMAKGQSDIH